MASKFEDRREKIAKMRAEKAKEDKLTIADMFRDMKPFYEVMSKSSILFDEMSKSITPKIVVDEDCPPSKIYWEELGSKKTITVADSSYLHPGMRVDLVSSPLWTPAPKTRYYTGIGSRETPLEVLAFMRFLAITLAREGWVLRSGGAEGADSAFAEGADDGGGNKHVFLPWKGFGDGVGLIPNPPFWKRAEEIAKEHHPAWDRLKPAGKKLHTRNVFQVLGGSLDTNSEFVVCWTKDGKGRGGTGQAIRIARAYGVPVFDIDGNKAMDDLSDFLGKDLLLDFEEWRG